MHAHRILLTVLLTAIVAAASGSPAESREVRLEVTDSGQYILAGKPVALADLRARLRDLKSSGAPINLHVIGGPKVTYELVMPAMQIVQEEGLGKVGLLTSPPAASDSSASASSK